ncbi:MAG: class I SAM-dependent methyltransferase [bacterium]
MQGRDYWNKRFEDEEKIWGETPSISATYAAKIFKENEARTILVPGCGYGRNSLFLAKEGFTVTAFDFSSVALKTAREIATNMHIDNVEYYEGNALDEKGYKGVYEGIYVSNLLHLFLKDDREILLRNLEKVLCRRGIISLNVFSPEDSSYGEGELVEENTYYSNDGHFTHYFTQDSLMKDFLNFELLSCEKIREFENHGEKKEHSHNFLFAAFRKLN